MRPLELDVLDTNGERRLYFVVSGSSSFESDGTIGGGYAAAGAIGFVILAARGDNFGIVAKSNLYEPIGSFGTPPSADQVELRELGPNGRFGWVVTTGYTGLRINIGRLLIFAPVGDRVLLIGNLPYHYDDAGSCKEGEKFANVPCSEYSFTMTIDAFSQAEHLFDVILNGNGNNEDVILEDSRYRIQFDNDSLKYRLPSDLPDRW